MVVNPIRFRLLLLNYPDSINVLRQKITTILALETDLSHEDAKHRSPFLILLIYLVPNIYYL